MNSVKSSAPGEQPSEHTTCRVVTSEEQSSYLRILLDNYNDVGSSVSMPMITRLPLGQIGFDQQATCLSDAEGTLVIDLDVKSSQESPNAPEQPKVGDQPSAPTSAKPVTELGSSRSEYQRPIATNSKVESSTSQELTLKTPAVASSAVEVETSSESEVAVNPTSVTSLNSSIVIKFCFY